MSELHEIINRRPAWIIRWGNLFFLLILSSVVAMIWFIRYPDIVHGTLRIYRSPGSRGDGGYYGRLEASAPIVKAAEKGQVVLIKLPDYPDETYGYLPATIDSLPGAAVLTVLLPNGLVTTRGRAIAYTDRAIGNVQIRLGERRLAQRLFQQLSPRLRHP